MVEFHNINQFTNGWFVGDFEPSLIKTGEAEVAYRQFSVGDAGAHVHKIATEITLIVKGVADINGMKLYPGDIAVIKPGEVARTFFLEPTSLIIVKVPSVPGDKYLVD